MTGFARIRGTNGTNADNRRAIDELINRVQMLQVIPGTTIELRQTWNGVLLDVRKQPGSRKSIAIERYEIESIQDDYLTGALVDADGDPIESADSVNIAKPFNLMVSQWNGQTVGGWDISATSSARIFTINNAAGFSNGATYVEYVKPAYLIGDLIYAARADTSVADCDWIDLNVDARNWFKPETEVRVCVLVNGTPTERKMIVAGGPVYS